MPTTLEHDGLTRADLIDTATHLNDQAKALSRQGHTGTDDPHYAGLHAELDAIIGELVER